MSQADQNTTTKTKSSKLPALSFYPGDWKRDIAVQALDITTRGVWFELLLLMHDSDERGVLLINGKPPSIETIARLIGADVETTKQGIENIKSTGVCDTREDGALINRRMIRDAKVSQIRSKARTKYDQNDDKIDTKLSQNTEYENESENEDQSNKNSKADPERVQESDHVWVTKKYREHILKTHGPGIYRDCIKKLHHWIAEIAPQPGERESKEFQIRKRKGWNGTNTISNWVLDSVLKNGPKRPQPKVFSGTAPPESTKQKLAQNGIDLTNLVGGMK